MNYKDLSLSSWKTLNSSGTKSTGYKGIWLSFDQSLESDLHIFKDEAGCFHLAVEIEPEDNLKSVFCPNVNGLSVSVAGYLITGKARNFIDIQCNIDDFLTEFTKVTKEICDEIFVVKKDKISAVNQVIRKWIVFWAEQNNSGLTVDEQVGLLCELIVLKKLIEIDADKAINSWVGPLRERHDFIFANSSVEVKGTRRILRSHTINGLDQLSAFPNKELLFVSFLIVETEGQEGVTLPEFVDDIYSALTEMPELVVMLGEKLVKAGYSPFHREKYLNRFSAESPECYLVDSTFPSITSESMSERHIRRISSVVYDINLSGIPGTSLSDFSWSSVIA